MERYDAIVLGVGGMGSATVYHLARRGLKVLGLERYNIPNDIGSSHGVTRLIRLAYFEHPDYVPLLRRAYELWRELEHLCGERLLFITGTLDIGKEGSRNVEGSRTSCELYHLPHEVLTGPEVSRRFPGYHLPADIVALYQPDGGMLLPERCIVAHVTAAQALGAQIHAQEQVAGWEPQGEGVVVRTNRATYGGGKLVISAGAWAPELVPQLHGLAVPERQVLGWFQPLHPELFRLGSFPGFNMMTDEGQYYGLPIYGVPGVKIGKYHHLGQRVDPDRIDRECHPEDEDVLRVFVRQYLPDAMGATMALKTCIFTNTPDEHFILDRHPKYPQVCLAAGFSGHGFKFCSVVGEIMADLVQHGSTRHKVELFQLARLSQIPQAR